MKKSFQMIVVLSLITLISGLALGGLQRLTYERAQNNILKFKKIPAVADIYEIISGKLPAVEREALEEGLLAEKRFLDIGERDPSLFFVIRKNGEPYAVAIEDFGQGFAGDLGVMVGFNLESGDLVGIGITTMSETPGLGTHVRDDMFIAQFNGLSSGANFKVKKDGGDIDAVTGATISSRAVGQAIESAKEFYAVNHDRIVEAIDQAPGDTQ